MGSGVTVGDGAAIGIAELLFPENWVKAKAEAHRAITAAAAIAIFFFLLPIPCGF